MVPKYLSVGVLVSADVIVIVELQDFLEKVEVPVDQCVHIGWCLICAFGPRLNRAECLVRELPNCANLRSGKYQKSFSHSS